MYAFLSSYELPRDIGSKYEYSNLGVGLLGHVLALRAGMDYEKLVQTRILTPLKMTSTAITFTPTMKLRYSVRDFFLSIKARPRPHFHWG